MIAALRAIRTTSSWTTSRTPPARHHRRRRTGRSCDQGVSKARKQANEITAESDDALHEVRKTAKKARYAAELAEPVAGKRAARFVKQAKAFQDVVGEHQDAVVAEERLRELAATRSGSSLLAAGRLIEGTDAPRRGEGSVSKGGAVSRRPAKPPGHEGRPRPARPRRPPRRLDGRRFPQAPRQARAPTGGGLAAPLTALGVDRLVSSPSVRCVETFEPAAASMGLELEQREELAEGASPDEVRSLLADLDGATPALCTHGDVVEALLGERLSLKKGAARVLELLDGESASARRHRCPRAPGEACLARVVTPLALLG